MLTRGRLSKRKDGKITNRGRCYLQPLTCGAETTQATLVACWALAPGRGRGEGVRWSRHAPDKGRLATAHAYPECGVPQLLFELCDAVLRCGQLFFELALVMLKNFSCNLYVEAGAKRAISFSVATQGWS